MFRRVIVAFDGSERAQDAVALALRLRDPDDGVLTLACTVVDETPDEVALMLADARARIPAGIHVKLRAPVASSPARGLTELAEQEHADLVVVGSSRHGASGRISLERTAGRLLQGAPCAVAVPPAALRERGRFHHVGVAYDGSVEAHAARATAYEIAAANGAAVTVLYALPMASAPELEPDACDRIVDLLVTGSRSHGPVQSAMLGSVSEALTDGASYPVLVVPRQAATSSAIAAETASLIGAPASNRAPSMP